MEVVLDGEVIATTTAGLFSPTLVAVGVGDGVHAFYVQFEHPLTEAQRDRLIVRPQHGQALERAPELVTEFFRWGVDPTRFHGYVDERSTHHAAGWARNADDADDKLELEFVLPGPEGDRVVARTRADRYSRNLAEIGVGNGVHAFHILFSPPLNETDRDCLETRIVKTGRVLPLAPELRTQWQPIAYLAMDIVNNCNLRCPFCLVDYAGVKTTRFMSDATFDTALKLIPYVTDGNFWLSCLHEATLHPKLLDFIARVPREFRHKVYYTTNLAKRMPDRYFEELSHSGLHHLNISIESLDPEIYQRMRAGARYHIFLENWEKLLAYHQTGSAAPPLRYNIMCYRSNLREIPGLVELLLRDKRAWQVELRHTYDAAHIETDFRRDEYLKTEEWVWLKQQLAHHDPARVVLILPVGERGYEGHGEPEQAEKLGDEDGFHPHLREDERAWNQIPRPFNLQMTWEGVLRIQGWKPQGPGEPFLFNTYLKTNIHFLPDPVAFLTAL
jgi:molybdenum cofactor biosynthesis enzyme MoaA